MYNIRGFVVQSEKMFHFWFNTFFVKDEEFATIQEPKKLSESDSPESAFSSLKSSLMRTRSNNSIGTPSTGSLCPPRDELINPIDFQLRKQLHKELLKKTSVRY